MEHVNRNLEVEKTESFNQVNELQRDQSDAKYKEERLAYQVKIKDETIT